MSWSLCAFGLAHWAHPLCCKVCVFFFHLPGPSLCTTRVMCAAEICMPCLTWHPGPPSAPRDFCGLLLVPWACHLVRAIVCELFIDWGVQLSLFFLPSKFQLCLAFPDSATPLWGPLWRSCSVHRNSSCFTTPSFPWGTTPIQKFSIFSLLMSPSSLLPYSRELSLSPLEACSLLLSPRGWFVGIVLYLDEFLEVDFGGGWPSLHLTPLPSFSVLYLGFIYLFFPPVPDL